jgi:hypothetical protein
MGLSQFVVTKSKIRMGFMPSDPAQKLSKHVIQPEILTAFVTRPQSRYKLTPDIAIERKVVGVEKEDLMATADAVLRELGRYIRKKTAN